MILSYDWCIYLVKVFDKHVLEEPGQGLRQDEEKGSKSLFRIYGSAEAELEQSLQSKLDQPPPR